MLNDEKNANNLYGTVSPSVRDVLFNKNWNTKTRFLFPNFNIV